MTKIIKGVFLILMLDCEQSARLTSESFDRPLSRWERWALRIHQACCSSSYRVARQMEMVARGLKERNESQQSLPALSESLSEEARDRIRQNLRDLS